VAEVKVRTRRTRRGRLSQDAELRAVVQAKLEQEWSPEQIAGYLRATFPARLSWK
jgi:IS30 family transposase